MMSFAVFMLSPSCFSLVWRSRSNIGFRASFPEVSTSFSFASVCAIAVSQSFIIEASVPESPSSSDIRMFIIFAIFHMIFGGGVRFSDAHCDIAAPVTPSFFASSRCDIFSPVNAYSMAFMFVAYCGMVLFPFWFCKNTRQRLLQGDIAERQTKADLHLASQPLFVVFSYFVTALSDCSLRSQVYAQTAPTS